MQSERSATNLSLTLPADAVDAVPPAYRALTHPPGTRIIEVIDQRALPHALVTVRIADADGAADAIRQMIVRGAPLIGAVGAYGLALALDAAASDAELASAHAMLDAARPTAVNLRWALDRVRARVSKLPPGARADAAWNEADAIYAEDIAINLRIGRNGLALLRELAARRDRPLSVMTHCNAGALATCGFGTATAPLFLAHDAGIPLHVWVSETRPRMQGASLTAWELAQHGIAHTLVVDSASGLLMRRGEVDLVIVGADRVAANGDVCNKIGTYDKALAARDNDVPFAVALPTPTIDWNVASGDAIPIESRSPDEVLRIAGRTDEGRVEGVAITSASTPALNFAFDVTPARLVTHYVTDRGAARGADALRALYAEQRAARG
jgi:methylthioribose-1-phosphate isomerase